MKPDVADFNLDGNLDVALGTCFQSQVSVLLGNGDGTLAPFDEFPNQGICPHSTETADMNNDRIPDIEMANFNGESISVHLGLGDGTFQTPILTPLPDGVTDLVVRDFNGDGVQDAAAVAYTVHKLYILLGNGDGTLQHVGTLSPGKDPIQIDAGDFNNDGLLDLAVANQNISQLGSFSCFLGNGDGTFEPKVDYPTGGSKSQMIAVGDFGNDGIADVVVANTLSNRLSVFKGNGNGTFQPPTPHRVRNFPTGLAIGDFNQDGFNDIAVSCQNNSPSSVTVLLNDQSNGFYRHSMNLMPQTFYVVAGDLNNDAYIDLIASNGAFDRVTVLLNDAAWASPTPVPVPYRRLDNVRPCTTVPSPRIGRPQLSLMLEASPARPSLICAPRPKPTLLKRDDFSLSWPMVRDVLTPWTGPVLLSGGVK